MWWTNPKIAALFSSAAFFRCLFSSLAVSHLFFCSGKKEGRHTARGKTAFSSLWCEQLHKWTQTLYRRSDCPKQSRLSFLKRMHPSVPEFKAWALIFTDRRDISLKPQQEGDSFISSSDVTIRSAVCWKESNSCGILSLTGWQTSSAHHAAKCDCQNPE